MPPTPEEVRDLFAMATSGPIVAERVARADGFDPERRWVKEDGARLSDRLWRARAWDRQQIDALLVDAIRTGEDALVTAKKLEQFLDPAFAPIRTDRGRLVRGQRRAIVTQAPGRGGSGSFPARRLSRTEITRAHGAGTIAAAEKAPWVRGVRWLLSGRHPKADPCNGNAERDSGLGPGVYAALEVPTYPNHPQCLCTLAPVVVEDVDKVVEAIRQQFGLGTVAPPPPTSAATTRPQTAPAAPPPSPGAAQPAVPEIRTEAELRAFFGSIGVEVNAATKSPAIWNTVARAYADQVAAGRPVPPVLNFVAKQSKHDVAAYTRHLDAKTGRLVREEMNIYQRNPLWKDEALARRQEESGWWSSGDPDGVVIHEFGHFEHFHRVETDRFNYTLKIGDTVRSKSLSPAERAIANRVSHYGAQNAFEFVAETYTGVRKGKAYDDEIMALYRLLGGPEL